MKYETQVATVAEFITKMSNDMHSLMLIKNPATVATEFDLITREG